MVTVGGMIGGVVNGRLADLTGRRAVSLFVPSFILVGLSKFFYFEE